MRECRKVGLAAQRLTFSWQSCQRSARSTSTNVISKMNQGRQNRNGVYSEQENKAAATQGRGHGLASMAAAWQGNRETDNAPGTWGAGQPMTPETLLAAWFNGDKLASLAATLAGIVADEQGKADMRLARQVARLLRRRMECDGRMVNDTMEDEAASAAVVAIVEWRNGKLSPEPVNGDKMVSPVAVAAWRAAVKAMSDDGMGHTVDVSGVSDDWLLQAVEPLAVACLAGWETRHDKAKRLLRERGAARRKAGLAAHMERFKGVQRKAATVERVETALRRMIDGEDMETAAAAVGFKARPNARQTAASQLAFALKRSLGIVFDLTLKKAKAKPESPCHRQTFPVREIPAGELWAYGVTATATPDGHIAWE